MSRALDTPLPGDLVIRPQRDDAGMRRGIIFMVATWPHLETIAGPYQSYGYARLQTRAIEAKRGVQVWREHSMDPERSQLEKVSETET